MSFTKIFLKKRTFVLEKSPSEKCQICDVFLNCKIDQSFNDPIVHLEPILSPKIESLCENWVGLKKTENVFIVFICRMVVI